MLGLGTVNCVGFETAPKNHKFDGENLGGIKINFYDLRILYAQKNDAKLMLWNISGDYRFLLNFIPLFIDEEFGVKNIKLKTS